MIINTYIKDTPPQKGEGIRFAVYQGKGPAGDTGYHTLTGAGMLCLQMWDKGSHSGVRKAAKYIQQESKFDKACLIEYPRKGLWAIAAEITDLATRAQARKVKPDEMGGASMSISNLGGIGGTGFSPIVSWPEVAILGVSRTETVPSWDGQAFVPAQVLVVVQPGTASFRVEALLPLGFDGFGFGGWPLTLDGELAGEILAHTAGLVPDHLPRFALGLGKPEHIAEKIVTGKMEKFFEQEVLLEQPFAKDSSMTVGAFVRSQGGDDAFLAAYDGTGGHVWSRTYGGTAHDSGRAVIEAGDGSLVVEIGRASCRERV